MKDWFDLVVITVASVVISGMLIIPTVTVSQLKTEVIELKKEVRQYERMVEQNMALILKDKEL